MFARRDLLLRLTATAAAVVPALAAPEGHKMKMSLSVRVAEAFHNKEQSTKTIDELIALARS
ncbi:MAG: hypothetical protein FJW38_24005, partial [Acidobacteria bacterium]|nr:hypothetical protein [Acidobacteriota bacterium]